MKTSDLKKYYKIERRADGEWAIIGNWSKTVILTKSDFISALRFVKFAHSVVYK